jgi:hypothetical protein
MKELQVDNDAGRTTISDSYVVLPMREYVFTWELLQKL